METCSLIVSHSAGVSHDLKQPLLMITIIAFCPVGTFHGFIVNAESSVLNVSTETKSRLCH